MGDLPPAVVERATLLDGTPVRIRPVAPEDRAALLEFLEGVSQDSRWMRFCSAIRPELVLPELLAPGGDGGRGVVIELEPPRGAGIIAHGEFVRDPSRPSRAEVAFLVTDEWQGRGAGTVLLHHLVRAARAVGIQTLEAVTTPANSQMMAVFFASGLPYRVASESGEVRVTLEIGARSVGPVDRLGRLRGPLAISP